MPPLESKRTQEEVDEILNAIAEMDDIGGVISDHDVAVRDTLQWINGADSLIVDCMVE